jgi:hypothetical protein
MTANFVKMPWDLLERISTRITNELPEVVSVAYFVSVVAFFTFLTLRVLEARKWRGRR